MWKKILEHILVGFSISVAVALTVQISVGQATGQAVVTREFAARFTSEGVAALVLQIERWSYLRQGVVHFLITAAVWAPVSLLCWSAASGWGLWIQLGSWAFTYAVIWLVQYLICRRRVAETNARIAAQRRKP